MALSSSRSPLFSREDQYINRFLSEIEYPVNKFVLYRRMIETMVGLVLFEIVLIAFFKSKTFPLQL